MLNQNEWWPQIVTYPTKNPIRKIKSVLTVQSQNPLLTALSNLALFRAYFLLIEKVKHLTPTSYSRIIFSSADFRPILRLNHNDK